MILIYSTAIPKVRGSLVSTSNVIIVAAQAKAS